MGTQANLDQAVDSGDARLGNEELNATENEVEVLKHKKKVMHNGPSNIDTTKISSVQRVKRYI